MLAGGVYRIKEMLLQELNKMSMPYNFLCHLAGPKNNRKVTVVVGNMHIFRPNSMLSSVLGLLLHASISWQHRIHCVCFIEHIPVLVDNLGLLKHLYETLCLAQQVHTYFFNTYTYTLQLIQQQQQQQEICLCLLMNGSEESRLSDKGYILSPHAKYSVLPFIFSFKHHKQCT